MSSAVTSIRLRPDQIARLPKGQGAKVIRLALARWRKGEIVIQNKGTRKKWQRSITSVCTSVAA